MKIVAGVLSILVSLSCISAAGATTGKQAVKMMKRSDARHKQIASHPAVRIAVAPADEYFGRLKMSILGIRNTLKDLALKADGDPAKAENVFGSAAFAEEALREWEQKYPRDPWLGKTVAALVHLYARVPTEAGRSKMHAAMAWLKSKYGSRSGVVAAAEAEVAAAGTGVQTGSNAPLQGGAPSVVVAPGSKPPK